jgi:PilZ domain
MSPESPLRIQVQRRHSERVLLRIPIEVKGKDSAGKMFKEVASTLVINRDGARITLKQAVRVNDRLTITNLRSQTSCPFRVVSQGGQSLGEGPEYGIECLERNLAFWGIEFPDKSGAKAAKPPEQEVVDALIECSVCRFRELAQLRMAQFRALSERSSLSRTCIKCNVATEWRFSSADGDGGKAASSPGPILEKASAGGAERRRTKRITVKLPVRIRLINGREEVTRTENLSKTGVCFISEQTMTVGQPINLTVGYEPGKNESEIGAQVLWNCPVAGTSRTVYGVHLEENS